MPRVKLGQDPKRERIELRRRMISAKAAIRGYESRATIAGAVGMDEHKYRNRLRGDTAWQLDDLAALDKVLRFTDAELAQLVRGR